jgi:hypothetical protein
VPNPLLPPVQACRKVRLGTLPKSKITFTTALTYPGDVLTPGFPRAMQRFHCARTYQDRYKLTKALLTTHGLVPREEMSLQDPFIAPLCPFENEAGLLRLLSPQADHCPQTSQAMQRHSMCKPVLLPRDMILYDSFPFKKHGRNVALIQLLFIVDNRTCLLARLIALVETVVPPMPQHVLLKPTSRSMLKREVAPGKVLVQNKNEVRPRTSVSRYIDI